MANTALKLVRRDVQATRADNAQAIVPSEPIHKSAFAEAQSKAREWAEKAIDLYQVGDIEQTRHAARQAEVWLARMGALEATFRSEPRSTIGPESCPARSERRSQNSVGAPMRLLSSYRAPTAFPPVANHMGTLTTLRAGRGR
ncbi:MAG: hypothetical protein WAN26_10730 [Steroidobacteraceae bacterium]